MSDLLLKTFLGTDFEIQDKYFPAKDAYDQFSERIQQQQVRKDLPGIADASWNEPLVEVPVEKAEDDLRSFAAAYAARRMKQWQEV